jgi:hypothetical protein
MIPKDVQPAKVVIDSKGQKANIPAPRPRKGRKVPDRWILHNEVAVVKMEGGEEGVGIDKEGREG